MVHLLRALPCAFSDICLICIPLEVLKIFLVYRMCVILQLEAHDELYQMLVRGPLKQQQTKLFSISI